MAEIVYFLCAITSSLCALMLLRNYSRRRVKLLMWSGICFLGLALNNIVVVVDLLVLPHVDLSIYRVLPATLGFMAFIWGLISDV